MKYEIRIEYNQNDQLLNTIQKSYFEDGTKGKLVGKKAFLTIDKEDPLFIVFKGLNNLTAKLTNEDLIDGSMRCVVDETDESINLFPINNYCVMEQEKYSFY